MQKVALLVTTCDGKDMRAGMLREHDASLTHGAGRAMNQHRLAFSKTGFFYEDEDCQCVRQRDRRRLL